LQVLTVHYGKGNNVAYFEFVPLKKAGKSTATN